MLTALMTCGLAVQGWAAEREDLAIFNDVSQQIQRYAYFTIFDTVSADVDGGAVVLTGKVTSPFKATEIAKRAAKVDGVRSVTNRIETLPVSSFDDELRLRIARAIYNHPALTIYGHGLNPSIHVIVERGRVTLDGVVNNDADRVVAGMAARGFQTFKVTNDLKTREEAKRDLERL